MEREFGQLMLDACEIGTREGIRLGLYVLGISLIWRVARIPDLSSYAAFMIGGAIAGLIHTAHFGFLAGFSLAICAGAITGAMVFLLWRRRGLNIIIVGVLLSSVGFSATAILIGFKATILTTELLSPAQPGPWATATTHLVVMVAALLFFAIFFQSSWGSNLFTWSRSMPLASQAREKSLRSPDLIALMIGGMCVAVNGFMRARDHGELSLNEGRDLLFKALVMIVLGETFMVVCRLLLHGIARPSDLRLRKHFGFASPFLILISAPVGAILYWILVNVTDSLLLKLGEYLRVAQDWSGLSQGVVALLALCCLVGLGAFGRKEDIYEPWRFRG